MNLMKKAVSALGGIFLAALLIAALTPKAVRSGVVAALVQVVNPRSSPVPVDTVRQSASNFLALYTSTPSFPATWIQIFPDGTVGTAAYAIPEGEQLVITDVLVVAACNTSFFGGTCPSAGTHFSVVFPAGGGFSIVGPFSYAAGATYGSDEFGISATHADHLTSGMVFTQLPNPFFNLGSGSNSGERYTVTMQGYLTP